MLALLLLLLMICRPFDVTVVLVKCEPFVTAETVLFKFNGIAALVALNSAGEMPSDADKLMAIE